MPFWKDNRTKKRQIVICLALKSIKEKHDKHIHEEVPFCNYAHHAVCVTHVALLLLFFWCQIEALKLNAFILKSQYTSSHTQSQKRWTLHHHRNIARIGQNPFLHVVVLICKVSSSKTLAIYWRFSRAYRAWLCIQFAGHNTIIVGATRQNVNMYE